MKASAFFAQSYAEARSKFLAAAAAAGLDPVAHPHPLLGRDGELLAMDVARHGPVDAEALLIVSSACHGVEGYCGSGVQNALLADSAFHAAADRAGVALLYVHALNPYGFSWLRRTTHENVDPRCSLVPPCRDSRRMSGEGPRSAGGSASSATPAGRLPARHADRLGPRTDAGVALHLPAHQDADR